MKTRLHVLFFVLSVSIPFIGKAQTTAMDFNIVDCNGAPHHLFSDLDAGKVVIIEYFMNSCSPCITAGQQLEAMKTDLLAEYPGKIKAYTFAFNNSYSCTTVRNWVTNNGFTTVPSDSGAAQVAYYGGMGMPTIVILGGTNHSILGSPYIGFSTSDTTMMAADIRNFLGSASVNENSAVSGLNVFPNPANAEVKVSFTLKESSDITIEIVDVTGRVVATVMKEKAFRGEIIKTFNTAAIAQGNYVIRINANGSISQQKLNVIH